MREDELFVILFVLFLIADDIFLSLFGGRFLVIFCFSLAWALTLLWQRTYSISVQQWVQKENILALKVSEVLLGYKRLCEKLVFTLHFVLPHTAPCLSNTTLHLPHHCLASWPSSASGLYRHQNLHHYLMSRSALAPLDGRKAEREENVY